MNEYCVTVFLTHCVVT